MSKVVIIAGIIIEEVNTREDTRLVLLHYPANHRGRPQTDPSSGGRFLVLTPEYLETAIYRAGRALTVAGEVRGPQCLPGGETVYRYPLLAPRAMYLWPEGDGGSPLFHFGFGFGFSNPTTSLSCADQICPLSIAAFRAQATKGSGVLRPRKPL